jgi:hypothetical protein
MSAAGAQVTHRSLDGRRFVLSGGLDLGQPGTSVLGTAVRGRLHELTAGPAGLGDEVAAALGVGRFDEELSYQGGTLLVGRARPYDRRTRLVEDLVLAVWRGRDHSLVTQFYGASTAGILAVLRTLRISEHRDGVSVRPEPGAGSDFTAPATVLKEVPGLGLLEVSPLTDQHARTLPSWSGLSVSGGELFSDRLSDGRPYFVLATSDTWTTVVPLPGSPTDRIPGLLGGLSVGTVV